MTGGYDYLCGGTGLVKVPPLSPYSGTCLAGARQCKICGAVVLGPKSTCDACRRRGARLREKLFGRGRE